MAIDFNELRSLPVAEKLRIVELLWDDIGAADGPLPIPEWHKDETERRRDEILKNPDLGLSHGEIWRRIREHHG